MKIVPLYFLIVHVVTTISYGIDGDEFCSSFCVCDMWYKLRRAICTSRHLYSIQTGVSNNVQALDLSNNSISSLMNYELKDAGLVNLRYLNLSDNSINQIGSFAFSKLDDLMVLDLSRNHLYYVLWDTFVESENLRILHLDGNRFGTRIPDLHSNSISELGLSSCQISYVHSQAFAGLQQLRKLDLSNNFMIQIEPREFRPLPFLREINLDNNPWSCDAMKFFLSYLKESEINFKSPCEELSKVDEVKKFEKMIDGRETRPLAPIKNEEKKIMKNIWIPDRNPPSPPPSNNCGKSKTVKANSTIGLFSLLKEIPPLLVFTVGFLLGLVTSMIGTYIWLNVKISCKCPKVPRRDRNRIIRDNTSQRISLLGPTCPGTPPPPYREVILHSDAYPTAPRSSLLI